MNKITKIGNHLNLEHGIKVILLELKNIPKKPGIYKMINSSNEPIYTTPILPTANQSNDLIFFFTFVVIGFISMWVLEKKFIGLNKEI